MGTTLPKLKHVVRLDSMPLGRAQFTDEGYLKDKPILTSTGIFEYTNPDGSIRRELRLPEEVFSPLSLSSYKGKPIIITHDAGLVTKDNVHENQVGTILSDGIRSGEDVRADIIIHDTDEMKERGYKELSLGYNLDLDETPGTWNGQHYDAIQRNIIINHLALVREARAGEQARLNIDSRDSDTLKGGKAMKNTPKKTTHGDSVLSPDELEKAIKEYKARRAKENAGAEKEAAEKPAPEKKPVHAEPAPEKPQKANLEEDMEAVEEKPATVEEKIQKVKDNRDRRDEEGDPKDKLSAMGMIAHQDEDIDTLFDIIDTLLAEREFKQEKAADSDEDMIPSRDKNADCYEADGGEELTSEEPESDEEVENADGDDEEETEDIDVEAEEDYEEDGDNSESEDYECDEEDEGCEEEPDDEDDGDDWGEDEDDTPDDEEFATDSHDSPVPDSTGEVHHVKKLNSDSVDAIVRQRIALGMMGRKLNMDGLENMGIMNAKKKIVKAVRPNIRLDGKSAAYINAAYDCAVDEINKRNHKGTDYQKKQMFNKDSKAIAKEDENSSVSAREKMIERQKNRNK